VARIVIAGRSAQSREQMASLLSSSGYPVYRLCSSAGELRRVLNDCDDGLLILAGQLPDCSADELFWDYGSQVQILLIARPPVLEACEEAGVFRLALPTSQQAVLGAVEMLTQLHRMRLPRRSADEKQLVEEAKALLMRRDGLTEPQAHRMLQQAAMSRGLRMADCAAQIIKGDGG
jgi:response regulator NasT